MCLIILWLKSAITGEPRSFRYHPATFFSISSVSWLSKVHFPSIHQSNKRQSRVHYSWSRQLRPQWCSCWEVKDRPTFQSRKFKEHTWCPRPQVSIPPDGPVSANCCFPENLANSSSCLLVNRVVSKTSSICPSCFGQVKQLTKQGAILLVWYFA